MRTTAAYEQLVATKPELKACWAEYFELLRSSGRGAEALQLADRARATFGESGFSLTLRAAALTELGRYPEALAERWFADTGSIVLASTPGPVAPSDETIVATFAEVAANCDWHFGQVILLGPEFPACNELADRMGAPIVTPSGLDPAVCPLVVGLRPLVGDKTWTGIVGRLAAESTGLVLALEHPAEAQPAVTADVVGVLTDAGTRRERAPNPAQAVNEARNAGARLAGRRLRPT